MAIQTKETNMTKQELIDLASWHRKMWEATGDAFHRDMWQICEEQAATK